MLARRPHDPVDLPRRVTGRFRPACRAGTKPYDIICGVTSQPEEAVFLRACRREPVPYTPVWYMRQAGRALPEYRRARARTPMLTACATPDLIAEITLQPVRRYAVDAAILFSDIVVPLKAIGVGIDIAPGVGPVVDRPIRAEADLAQLRSL